MNVEESESIADERILAKLSQSAFFGAYRDAFQQATGMELRLISAEADHEASECGSQSNFCRQLNERKSGCLRCQAAQQNLKRCARDGAQTETCFAGFRETLVPVKSGERTFAYLSVGEVMPKAPGHAIPNELKECFDEMQIDADERIELTEKWKRSQVMSKEQYQGIVTILTAFSLQLADLLNRILIEESHAEPEVVVKAKRYVNAHLEDKISLEEVATHVGVSPYYFCKVFKQSAGMTLTEFVNRRRVEWAKRRLLNPQSRVTEVAFDVGFQSISQFNRSFLRYVGESPTRFRDNQASNSRLGAERAA
ncbi:MAG: helix-turn-helix domain-containing protein [Verrucomicrobiota bacterium]